MSIRKVYFSLILLMLIVANDLSWRSLGIGLAIGLGYLVWHGHLLGRTLFKRENAFIQILIGSFIILSAFSLFGAVAYYLYKLTPLMINGILLIIPVIIFSLQYLIPHQVYRLPLSSLLILSNTILGVYLKLKLFLHRLSSQKKLLLRIAIQRHGLIILYIFLMVLNWIIVIRAETIQSLNSIWQAIPPTFFISYGLATLTLVMMTTSTHQRAIHLTLVRSYIFLTLGLAAVIYHIGYGFDPFIHRASEQLIAQSGVVTPKTPYYIGQYSLVVIVSHLWQISVTTIDRWLMPLLYSFFVPAFIYLVFRQIARQQVTVVSDGHDSLHGYYYLLPLIVLLIPFSDFIVTTPQSLANFFALIIIIASVLLISQRVNYRFSYLLLFLAATTLLIHPLTGIPLFFFALLVLLVSHRLKYSYLQNIIISLLIIVTLVSVPATFLLQSLISPHTANPFTLEKLNSQNISQMFDWFRPVNRQTFHLFQDYAHFFGDNIDWLLLLLASLGGYQLIRRAGEKRYAVYPLFFVLMVITYGLLKIFITFDSVIAYEQNDYPARILNFSWYFLLPLILYAAYQLIQIINRQPRWLKCSCAAALTLALTASLYISYPINDLYRIGHYHSVSADDLAAVRSIDDHATGDYIVLANQSVSAAALHEFGFKKYFVTDQGEFFFYPIPTSGPLYQLFLEMTTDQTSRQTMERAMTLMAVSQAYLVINDYWTDADQLIAINKTIADDWWQIGNGSVSIFYFRK
ncbi:hypothetical protein HY933_02715 [Candidatus Falkowbacteria bacterium]|nr:hypothetical protein [Candidatus Falkowbacteria bacterium]